MTELFNDATVGILSDFVIAPSGERVAFVRAAIDLQGATTYELVLISPGRQSHRTIPWRRDDWHGLVSWTRDELHVLVSKRFDSTHLPAARPDTLLRLSLEDGAEEMLKSTMPYSGEMLFDFWEDVGSSVLFNSAMTHVAILDGESSLVVWDQTRSTVVWRWVYEEGVMADLPRPIWSASGERLVVTTRPPSSSNSAPEYQFVSIDLSGQTVQSPILDHVANLENSDLSLSPDGQYLAFVVTDETTSGRELRLWNTESNMVTTTCIVDPLSAPVWSPNSHRVLVSIPAGSNESDDGKSSEKVVVMDVTTGWAASLAVGAFEPQAWTK